MNESPIFLDLVAAAAAIRSKEISIAELLNITLDRLENTEPEINAWAAVRDRSSLLSQANELQSRLDQDSNILFGLPFGVKDMIDTASLPTEAGSMVLRGRVPDRDADCVKSALERGGILIGKNQTHEFAFGVRTPQTGNPWNPDLTPGGSSGGSAAAVASGSAIWSFGTDTLGSVRMPATMCGVVGLKPTTGSLSNMGVIPLSKTLDSVGLLTRTIRDAREAFNSLRTDKSKRPQEIDGNQIRIGVLGAKSLGRIEPRVRETLEASVDELSKIYSIREVEIESFDEQVQIGFDFMLVEGAHWHEKLLSEKGDLYEPGIRAALQAGLEMSGTAYFEACNQRNRVKEIYRDLFSLVDVVITPGTPFVAKNHSAPGVQWSDGTTEPLETTMCRYTAAASLTGLPALSVPTGLVDGLPAGVQLIGRMDEEELLFKVGSKVETQLTPVYLP